MPAVSQLWFRLEHRTWAWGLGPGALSVFPQLSPWKMHLPPTLVIRDLVSAAPLPGALLLVKNPLSAPPPVRAIGPRRGTGRAGRKKLSEAAG